MAPSGGGDGYQVIIDKYYQEFLVKRNGKWTGHLNPGSDLTVDDIDILGISLTNSWHENSIAV